MKTYPMEKIRNVAFIGPHGVGKTSLADAVLHVTGKVGRRGNVDDGSSLFDFHEDEIEKKQTISASLSWTEVADTKINLIDTPGVDDFRGDVYATLRVIEGAVFVVKADGGFEVASESIWRLVRGNAIPSLIVINRMNKEHASFAETVASIADRVDGTAVPIQLPIGDGEGFRGIVDLITSQAFEFDSGKPVAAEIPSDLTAAVAEARENLMNAAAETDDELVEKFLEVGSLTEDEITAGLRSGILAGSVFPIYLTAADTEIGVKPLMDSVVKLLPSPATRTELIGTEPDGTEPVTRELAADGPPLAFAFKHQFEAQGGDVTWLRVFSGSISSGDNMINSQNSSSERIGQMSVALGRQKEKVETAVAGDIVLAAKLKSTATGSTLYSQGHDFALAPIQYPVPTSGEAINPVTAGEEDKMASGLGRIHEEDPTFVIRHEPELHQTLLIAQGEMHLVYILDKLKKQTGVVVERSRPRIAFKETVRGTSEKQGRYKKQTGGRGQFGDVHLRIEPLPRGAGFEFADEIVGGVVPGKFIPAVEKGCRETLKDGLIAGYEMVDLRVALFFGSFHQVDSSENSFKSAARVALKKAADEDADKLRPVILEPVMLVSIAVPQAYMGDVMGDISTRRGQIQGSDSDGPYQVVKAHVPEDELYQYATTLRSMSQGTGTFAMEFSHYAEVPGDVQKRLVEQYAKSRTEGDS